MGEKRHGRRRRGRRDFWREWREERRKRWQEQGREQDRSEGTPHEGAGGHFPPRMRARYWRQFFHEYTGEWPEEHWAIGGRRFSPWLQGMDEFNPFVASLFSKGGGLLPLYVLYLMDRGPRYGNEIMEMLSERTAGQWAPNPGAIYPLLAVLEEQGLIAGEWEDPHKRTVRVYRITEQGEVALDHMKAIVRPKLLEAVSLLQTIAQELNGDGDEEQMDYV